MRILAASLYKSANDIRLKSFGARARFAELIMPANQPVFDHARRVTPTQAEAPAWRPSR
jgi:fumarate hydratase class II